MQSSIKKLFLLVTSSRADCPSASPLQQTTNGAFCGYNLTDTLWIPLCAKEIFIFFPRDNFQCRLSFCVRTAPLHTRLHRSTSGRMLTIKTWAAMNQCFGLRKTLHTLVGIGRKQIWSHNDCLCSETGMTASVLKQQLLLAFWNRNDC